MDRIGGAQFTEPPLLVVEIRSRRQHFIEPNGQVRGRPEYQPVDVRIMSIGIEPQARKPVEHRVQ
jgi:hypothetical protein